jgi:hypothetical protein
LSNPSVLKNIPSTYFSGQALPLSGRYFLTNFNLPTNRRSLVFVTNVGDAGTVFSIISSDDTTVTRAVGTVPVLASADDAGGPTSGRAQTCAVNVVNTTAALNRAGAVHIIPLDQRMRLPAAPSAWTTGNFDTVFNDLVNFPSARVYDGSHFGGGHSLPCHVVDSVAFQDFKEWHGTLTIDEFFGHIGIWSGASARQRPMSTIVLAFNLPPVIQTYCVSVHARWYTRWPVDTVAGQSMTDIPVAAQGYVNRILEAYRKNQYGTLSYSSGPPKVPSGPSQTGVPPSSWDSGVFPV